MCQRCCNLLWAVFIVALVVFQQAGKKRQVFCINGIADALFKTRDAAIVDVITGGNVHLLNALAGGAFDGLHHALFARGDKQNRITMASGASGTTNAMHVGFGVVRNIVVQYVADAFDVKATCGNIGGNDNIEFAALELIDGALALFLLNVAVERCTGVATRFQLF